MALRGAVERVSVYLWEILKAEGGVAWCAAVRCGPPGFNQDRDKQRNRRGETVSHTFLNGLLKEIKADSRLFLCDSENPSEHQDRKKRTHTQQIYHFSLYN